jgi:hypothetical protein
MVSNIGKTRSSAEEGGVMAKHDGLLQFFTYAHLPPHLQEVSRPFGELARQIVDTLPENGQRGRALSKLLEAKDCAVRALLFKSIEVDFPPSCSGSAEMESIIEAAFDAAPERGETV